jgi:hypothetical protein
MQPSTIIKTNNIWNEFLRMCGHELGSLAGKLNCILFWGYEVALIKSTAQVLWQYKCVQYGGVFMSSVPNSLLNCMPG